MQILSNTIELQKQAIEWRMQGHRTYLVPTMGYFHAGHESLMRYARENGDKVITSLFVNPTQFGPGEDLSSYPSNLEKDAALAEKVGVDLLFTPVAQSMYEKDHATWIEVPELSGDLCGASRPGHFRGVCTVVMKLFMLCLPSVAVFGEKDWQQLAIIRRMVRDLNVPVEIAGRPIVREADGLAMSSRNVYLSAEERKQAPAIHEGLLIARSLVQNGEKDAGTILSAVREHWKNTLPVGKEDYLKLVHPDSLHQLDTIDDAALMATAVQMGKARLIDNMLLT